MKGFCLCLCAGTSVHFLYRLELVPAAIGRGTPWTGRRSITGPHRDKQPCARSTSQPDMNVFGQWVETGVPGEEHADTSQDSNREPSCCERTVPTTTPPCSLRNLVPLCLATPQLVEQAWKWCFKGKRCKHPSRCVYTCSTLHQVWVGLWRCKLLQKYEKYSKKRVKTVKQFFLAWIVHSHIKIGQRANL